MISPIPIQRRFSEADRYADVAIALANLAPYPFSEGWIAVEPILKFGAKYP
ncbi:hypothetical protein [Oculatella sp. LEGE 06141]|uniref:hypothetical protein n=1 Tax=Oculatella sp. LEGE 06141 TaxID=1828648 RepID=UPI0018830CDB|nr:hypothetical protein [Oculatella sp. LEGE 06141]